MALVGAFSVIVNLRRRFVSSSVSYLMVRRMLRRMSPVCMMRRNWFSVVAWWNSAVFSFTKNVSGTHINWRQVIKKNSRSLATFQKFCQPLLFCKLSS